MAVPNGPAPAAASPRLASRRAVSLLPPLRLPSSPLPPWLASRRAGAASLLAPPRRLRAPSSSTAAAVVALHKRNPKRLKYASQRQFTSARAKKGDAGMLRVTVEPSGGDFWKLDPVVDLINRGAVGVIPTDTVYSIVCDLSNSESIEHLRRMKGIGDSKARLAGLSNRFPRGTNQGQPNIFRAVKRAIPGPYTFILPASKQFPKQCIKHGSSTRYAKRRQVGVRIPDDPICQAILQNLDEPLICTSVKYLSEDEWILDPVIIADIYEPLGLDFIVDSGVRISDPSTVVDMTGTYPTIIRQGKGPKLDWMVTEEKEAQSTLAFRAA
ncbi:hypothetical protein ACP4OV_005603 [Aristida adscensionis]